MVKVAIIGAGINGLSCAVKIKEKYKTVEVVIFSKEFSPNTTGDGCGGLWFPFLCGDTDEKLLTKWGIETYNFLHNLWLIEEHNISLIPLYGLHKEENKFNHGWAKQVFGYEEIDSKFLEYLNKVHTADYKSGFTFNSFIVRPPALLQYLQNRFTDAGGKLILAQIHSMQDSILNEFNIIINASGLSSKTVVPDEKVYPVRGQITMVEAPWLCKVVFDVASDHYILPNAEMCVLGGTHQENDFNKDIDERDTDFINSGCIKIIPGLQNANVLSQWVGLRPGRTKVRLEEETLPGKLLIHNYGHGGSGFTLFWGCASDVLSILDKNFEKLVRNKRSKL